MITPVLMLVVFGVGLALAYIATMTISLAIWIVAELIWPSDD